MPTATKPPETPLRQLFRSLDERWRPEDVAKIIEVLLELSQSEKRTISKASKHARNSPFSSMSSDFQRPVDLTNQLRIGKVLFGQPVAFRADDITKIKEWLDDAQASIGKTFGDNDFKHSRLPKSERLAKGIDISRRQYNKRFRLAVRMEKKLGRFIREKFKRAIAVASKRKPDATLHRESQTNQLVGDIACLPCRRCPKQS